MEYMTSKELLRICYIHKYVLLRDHHNNVMGFNTKIAPLSIQREGYEPDRLTDYISYRSCSLNEYINKKLPFISQKQ